MISVVMPAHNEAAYLEGAVLEVVEGLRREGIPFEVVICENGSTDDTAEIARRLAKEHREVQAHSSDLPDYGAALRAGFLSSSGDEVVNFDVDGVDLEFLSRARKLADEEGADIVVGSKVVSGSADGRSLVRRGVTAGFSVVMRRGFGLGVSDTHGVKFLKRSPVAPIVLTCRFGQDIFDTELVLRAERAGLRVAELPVVIVERRPPRSPISRRIPRSLLGLARLRVCLWLGR